MFNKFLLEFAERWFLFDLNHSNSAEVLLFCAKTKSLEASFTGLPRDAGQRNKSSQSRFSLSHTSSEITVTNTQTYFRRDQSSCSWEEPFLWKNFAKRGDPRCLLEVLPLNQRLSAREKRKSSQVKNTHLC